MNVNFTIDGTIDLVATYAAILSTALAIWEFLKWVNKHSVRVTVTPNMLFIPSPDKRLYVVANVTNTGETATTITHYLGYHWPSRWHKFFKKGVTAFVVNCPNLPHVLPPGEQWMGQAHQDKELEQRGSQGVLYLGIMHSMDKKEILQRVIIKPKTEKSE